MTPVIIRPEAEADLVGCYRWYEQQLPGLGNDFLGRVNAVLEAISQHPQMYPAVHRGARRALLPRFPYAVFYVLEHDTASVIAVLHAARDPTVWQERL